MFIPGVVALEPVVVPNTLMSDAIEVGLVDIPDILDDIVIAGAWAVMS